MLMKVVLLTVLAVIRMNQITAVEQETGSSQVGCHSNLPVQTPHVQLSWNSPKQEYEPEGEFFSIELK